MHMPRLGIHGRGRPFGDFDDGFYDFAGNGFILVTAHAFSRFDELIELHFSILSPDF
jgi:hypothetical protein